MRRRSAISFRLNSFITIADSFEPDMTIEDTSTAMTIMYLRCGYDPGDAGRLPVGIHQCAGHGSAQEHEGKLLSRDASGAFAESGRRLVKSNAETGEGSSDCCGDISLLTSDRVRIIIELKYAHDGNLEAACAEALEQVEEKKYAEGLKRRGMKKIIKYGIAFYEKECMVAMV